MKKLLCASTASLALVLASAVLAPADAADLSIAPIYTGASDPRATWTGSYVGISGGGAWGSAVVRNDDNRCRPDPADRSQRRRHRRRHRGDSTSRTGTVVLGFEGDTSAHQQEGERVRVSAQCRLQQRGEGALAFDLPRPRRLRPGQLAALCHRRRRARQCRKQHRRARAAPFRTSTGIGAGPPAAASRSSSARTGRRKSSISTSDCRTNPISIRHRAWRFRAISAYVDDHIVRVGVNYKLPWKLLDSFFKRLRSFRLPLAARRLEIDPDRHVVGRLLPAAHMLVDAGARRGGRPPAATAAGGRCGCRCSSARRRPDSPRRCRGRGHRCRRGSRRSIRDCRARGTSRAGLRQEQRVVDPGGRIAGVDLARG